MSNSTSTRPCVDTLHFDVFSIVDTVLLFLLFVGLGLSCEPEDIRDALRKPKVIAVILLGQYGLMPLLGWVFSLAGNFPPELAVALVVCLSSPGGALSNILTTIFQGDVALSVGATGVSSLVAIGLMPLNQYVYVFAAQILPPESTICFKVVGIVWSAFIVVLAIVCGVLLKLVVRKHKWYRIIYLTYTLSGLAGVGIFVLGFVSNSASKAPWWEVPGVYFVCTIAPCIISSVLIWAISGWMKVPGPGRLSMVLEVGIHNKLIAIAAIGFVLNREQASRAMAIPIVYQFFASVYYAVLSIAAWKLGYTHLPRDKSFYQAFKLAREAQAERHHRLAVGRELPSSTSPAPATIEPMSSSSSLKPEESIPRQV
ncbi:hypothetical protein BASA81_002103 [Batrachochytrium salamandrivorans]|nr:hypothetical protein BASA81_002103 [Batrachochytrium salamandrivorans]